MRRPTFCAGVSTEDDCYCTGGGPLLPGDKEEGRLARVKRMLAGTLNIGRRGRTFGVRFAELPVGKEGVPKIVVRLCGYIENYGLRCAGLFRLSAGNPRLVERLRLSFDRTGEADLESCGDPQSVAALLKLWLRELPEPVIQPHIAEELLDIQEKFHEDLPEWREAITQALSALPEANALLLRHLLRFLHHCHHQPAHPARCRHTSSAGVETVFAPLLIEGSLVSRNAVATQLTGKLIREVKHLFNDRFVEHAYQAALGSGSVGWSGGSSGGDAPNAVHQRKRKERHESFNSQSQERKVIRSNSEERPLESSDKDNIRRVSSHEDFSLVKGGNKTNNNNNKNKGGFLSELIDPTMGHGVRYSQPLQEHNSPAVSRHPLPHHPHHSHDDPDVLVDDEHERRRSSERFARALAPRGRRNLARRRKVAHKTAPKPRNDADSSSGSSKENEDDGDGTVNANQLTPVSSSTSDDDSGHDEHKSHAFLQLHPQEKERSPSPSSSPSTPHLPIASLHELVDCNEPLKSRGHWSFSHHTQEDEVVTSQVMLSPRNSMVFPRRAVLDPNVPPSPPQEHNPRGLLRPSQGQGQDMKVKQLNKQISSIKRKLKRFEEEFERENGYRPSHADKMANRDVKNLGADLIKLRKEMKLSKEECHVSVMAKPLGFMLSTDQSPPGGSHNNKGAKNVNMEDLLQEVEQHLSEKRQSAGRPECLDELDRDQLMDEKVALQKGLLYLESVFGRPVTRTERDAVRPLYDRYRSLKRMVIRTGSSKLKDSVSELATILEHETMDFTSLPPATATDEKPAGVSLPADVLPGNEPAVATETVAGESSDLQLKNLHSLPLSKLLDQQRTIREDKKQLRRSLREFEDDFHRRTGKKLQREDRLPMETVYVAYKQAKAKLRLLEALVSKHTSGPQ